MGIPYRWWSQTPGNSGTSVDVLPTFIVQSGWVLAQIQTYTLPPDKLALAVNFAFARHVLYFASVAFAAIVLVALIRLRIAPRLRARKLPLVIAAIYAIITLFDLPAEVGYHAMSLHYGISIQPWM